MKNLQENTFVCLFAGFVVFSISTFAKPEAHYQPMPPVPNGNTNGATILPDHSNLNPNPPSPGGGPYTPPNSPGTTTNFQVLTDNNTLFPPDTHGAVRTNHVVTMLHTQVPVLTRCAPTLTTASLTNFSPTL